MKKLVLTLARKHKNDARKILDEYEELSRQAKSKRKAGQPLKPALKHTSKNDIQKFLLSERHQSASQEIYVAAGPKLEQLFSLLPTHSSGCRGEPVSDNLYPSAPPVRNQQQSSPTLSSPADHTRSKQQSHESLSMATQTSPLARNDGARRRLEEAPEEAQNEYYRVALAALTKAPAAKKGSRICGECKKLPLTNDSGHPVLDGVRYCPLKYPDLGAFRSEIVPLKKNKRKTGNCKICGDPFSDSPLHEQVLSEEGEKINLWYCPKNTHKLTKEQWFKQIATAVLARSAKRIRTKK